MAPNRRKYQTGVRESTIPEIVIALRKQMS
jgi:hypothetical protein